MKALLIASMVLAAKPNLPKRFYVAYDRYGTRITASENCQFVLEKAKVQDPKGYKILMYEQKPFKKCTDEVAAGRIRTGSKTVANR